MDCYECGKKKLYVNAESGLYFCQHCREEGHFGKFKENYYPADPFAEIYEQFHELSARLLIKDEAALNYLLDRGFTEESVVAFRYGYSNERVYTKLLKEFSKDELVDSRLWLKNEDKGYDFPYFQNHIIIPYMRGNRYVTFQGRALDEEAKKRYIFLPGKQPPLYHAEDLSKRGRVWLTEGAFKRDRLVQEGEKAAGISGASNFKKFLPELNRCEDLWIVLDSDAPDEKGKRPGNDAALEIAKALNACTIVTLPLPAGQKKIGVDDFIEEYGIEALRNLEGKRYERGNLSKPTALVTILAAWQQQVESATQRGYQTGHDRLDSWLEGYHPGSLTFLAGASHHGKTAYMEDSALRLHDRYENLTVDYYSNDDSLFLTIARWVAKIGRLKQKDVRYAKLAYKDDPELMQRYEAAVKKLSMKSDRLKILDRSYNIYLENLRDDLIRWRQDNPNGEKAVFIDAFTKTMTQKDDSFRGDTLAKDIYKSSLLKDISQQVHIPIICTTELPKLGGRRPNSWNIKGSGTLEYDADVILLCFQEAHVKGLNRTSIKIEYDDGTVNPVLEVIIGKDKICGVGRKTDLFEIRKTESKFRELNDSDYHALMRKVWESEKEEWK